MGAELSRRNATLRAFAFEDLVAELFEKLGYTVVRSARIGPGEVDLIVKRDGLQIPVEVSAVRSPSVMAKLRTDADRLRALLQTVDGLDKPIIVVGSDLTDAAKQWSEQQLDMSVWDFQELLRQASLFPDISAKLAKFRSGTPHLDTAIDSERQSLQRRLQDHIDNNDLTPSQYEDLCREAFIKLFDPHLYGFEKQAKTTDGGNRYDFICRIRPGNPFWDGIRQDFRTKAILFECKNYTDAVGPDQVYSTERYLFSGALRTVCILTARLGGNEAAIRAAQGAMRESGKLLILLSNGDLIEMLKLSTQEGGPEEFLDKRIWDFIISLPR